MPTAPRAGDLHEFPATALGTGTPLYRIALTRDPATGAERTPWFFSSLPSASPGRFDLPAPDGSCYFCDHGRGAWLEVFRQAGVVDRADVARRALFTAVRTGAPLPAADLRAAGARAFGVTGDLSAGPDYAPAQLWASALRHAGFASLVATTRHDPTAGSRTVVLFGPSGPRGRFAGWSGRSASLLEQDDLLEDLRAFGTGVASRPFDVEVTLPD